MENILIHLKAHEIEAFKTVTIKKGKTLFHENEKCNHLGIIKSGHFQIVSYSLNGKEILYKDLLPGMIFANNLVFSNHPFFKGDVKAVADGEIYLLTKEELLTLLTNNGSFLEDYLKLISNSEMQLNSQFKMLSFVSIEDRLIYYLYSQNGVITYKTITSLAKTLNVSREALSRKLTMLKNNKVVEIISSKHQIILKK